MKATTGTEDSCCRKEKAPSLFIKEKGTYAHLCWNVGLRKSKEGFYWAGLSFVITWAELTDRLPGPALLVTAVEWGDFGGLGFFFVWCVLWLVRCCSCVWFVLCFHSLGIYRRSFWVLKFVKGTKITTLKIVHINEKWTQTLHTHTHTHIWFSTKTSQQPSVHCSILQYSWSTKTSLMRN